MSEASETDGRGWNWRFISRILLTIYWLALFTGTHIPRPPEILTIENGDKYLHTTAYAGLALLLAWYVATRAWPTWGQYLAIFLGLLLYGAADELLQIPVHRSAEVADWLADAGGIILGLTLFSIAAACWRSFVSRDRRRPGNDSRGL